MDNKLSKIDNAFTKLSKQEDRFKDCERMYDAKFKDDFRSRTHKIKSSELKRSRLYVPLVKTTVNIIHAIFKTSFLSNGCPIEISRVGLNSDHDMVLKNTLSTAVKNKWKASKHYVGLSRAVLSSLYLPLGVVALYWDNDIQTKFIPINDIAFDPDARDINDVEYICYKWKQSRREIQKKFDSGFYKSDDKTQIINSDTRIEIKEIYEKVYKDKKDYWQLSTFADDKLVRTAKFDTQPFCFGYCFEDMPPIEKSKRDSYIGVYGSCLPEQVRELQEEYNIKRNQKIDITEMAIDPQFAISDEAGSVSMSDLISRRKYVRVSPNAGKNVNDLIMPLTVPSSYPISEEIAMLKSEYEVASGVNSIMTGQTNASDRRSMGALQAVNSASGIRVESMMQTLGNTMLNTFARNFVELIYKNMSDEEIVNLTENPAIIEKIGTLNDRKMANLDFDISVNFGTVIANEMLVNKLNTLLGVLAQNNLNNPNIIIPILKEIMTLMLGDNAPIDKIDEAYAVMMQSEQAAKENTGESGEAMSEPTSDENAMYQQIASQAPSNIQNLADVMFG
ncbi:hypothetical protein CIG2463D_1371 [Campylobacter iguaniorum]|uniref:portal protein n=1 Tax=Campylobacter iguaniorum TaxID=1244531 RepID=UPI00073A3F19|nr:hypothetical protein [Campylobacter iguaniorum]ALV24939.1 hypothetical protein CIG2463D_1371 [Campylobacter iguaniorum]